MNGGAVGWKSGERADRTVPGQVTQRRGTSRNRRDQKDTDGHGRARASESAADRFAEAVGRLSAGEWEGSGRGAAARSELGS